MANSEDKRGKAVPPGPGPVTVGELRDAYMTLMRAELGALETLSRVLRECPELPGAGNWTLTAALDPERRDAARKLLDRLGRVPLAETA